MLHEPPPDVPAGRLFRLLIQRPRPSWPLSFHLPDAPDFEFAVQAPTEEELSHVSESLSAVDFQDLRNARMDATLLSLCLVSADTRVRVFKSAGEVRDSLRSVEADALCREMYGALARIGPSFRNCNYPSWKAVLMRGAQEAGQLAYTLGQCVDYAFGYGTGRVVARPERFFGCALEDLTDGQWLAFYAAREVAKRDE